MHSSALLLLAFALSTAASSIEMRHALARRDATLDISKNIAAAQALNDVFGRVDHAAGDACEQPETVCNTAGTITLTCGADNKLAQQVCGAGTRCSALPKLDVAGVTIQCNTDADAQKILASAKAATATPNSAVGAGGLHAAFSACSGLFFISCMLTYDLLW
ncbi:hypothetical protein B0H19DRAFT_1135134 [Mycena capillaripes]|nr:hypothetical protein B0H19DRAFT_1135134 [Mycena capillaripes]